MKLWKLSLQIAVSNRPIQYRPEVILRASGLGLCGWYSTYIKGLYQNRPKL